MSARRINGGETGTGPSRELGCSDIILSLHKRSRWWKKAIQTYLACVQLCPQLYPGVAAGPLNAASYIQ
jgi:hypothetical protein